ncbi:MAG: DUF58 domain-containing protein [Planctomycetota bacterium]|jgi:uncharacterized protein (DUF58 family)
MNDYLKYLDPRTLNKIGRLELKARLIVEGFISGLHKSPYHGFSVEFAEHREYVPGDEIKHIDWKVFGRTDRFYVKQYEEETNLAATILLDTSESMAYTSPDVGVSKLEYASYVAASLAYLILQQQDAVALATFDAEINKFLPPSSHGSHLKNLLRAIEESAPARKTDVGIILHETAERMKKRGLVVLLSDLFDSSENLASGLQHLRHKKHEVILFHVLDRDEIRFPFQRMTLFEGLEALPKINVDPRALRKAYLEELNDFLGDVRKVCLQNGVDYVELHTDMLLDVALAEYLATRSAGRRSGSQR